jgi:ribose transport system substrate-binding protein
MNSPLPASSATAESAPTRRRRRRSLLALLVAAALALAALSACGSTDSGNGAGGKSDPAKTIGISFPNASTAPVIQNLFRLAKAKAKEMGYTLIIDDPGADENQQVNTIRTWIQSKKVAAIVCSTIDDEVVNSVAKEARDAGIKWVTFASQIPNQDATLGLPHKVAGEELGKGVAQWINENLGGKAKVGMLTNSPAGWARERADGILAELEKGAPGAEVVASQDALTASDGLAKTAAMLQANPDLDVVLAADDTPALGAYQAFQNAGHAKDDPKVLIGGVNGSEDQLKLVKEGTMIRMEAAFNQKILGEGFVTLPDRLLNGQTGDLLTSVTLVGPDSPEIDDLLSYFGG